MPPRKDANAPDVVASLYGALVLDRLPTQAKPQPIAIKGPRAFLTSEHEIHRLWMPEWTYLERAMKGGRYMTELLRPFDWEQGQKGLAKLGERQRAAVYPNFAGAFLRSLSGHLAQNAPRPYGDTPQLSFGGLGSVGGDDRDRQQPSRADLVYYNCDGTGQDGTAWDPWWRVRDEHALGYGHTWIMTEGPSTKPRTRKQEQTARPFLVEWTPPSVWDWHYENGTLQYAILRAWVRRPRLVRGRFVNRPELRFYLHTHTGFDGFGPEYASGGYWLYDAEGNPVQDANGLPVTGNYDRFQGEIPLTCYYAEEDAGVTDLPAISRSQITELAALAHSHMNIESAADFEAWDTAKGMEWIIGATKDAFNLAMAKIAEGSRWVPLTNAGASAATQPQVVPAGGDVATETVFTSRLTSKIDQARLLGGIGATSTPDASGVSKEAGWQEQIVPLLMRLVEYKESAQNTVLRNLELRFGVRTPTAVVTWPKRFSLTDVQTDVADAFEALAIVGGKSKTLAGVGIERMLAESDVVTDQADIRKIRTEVEESITAAAQSSADLNARLGDFRSAQASRTGATGIPGTGGTPPEPSPATPPATAGA